MPVALQILRRMDAGEALELSGVPDAALQHRLRELFKHLHLHTTRKVSLCSLLYGQPLQ